MRVVGSLTTIPGRHAKLLRTLRSLNKQDHKLDAIYLTVPRMSRRLGIPYPDFPPEITELCTIVTCDYDYGPATKIVGGLLQEEDPNTIIITFDDDVYYNEKQVGYMLRHHVMFPDAAIGGSGMLLKYGFPFYSTISNVQNNWNRMTGFEMPATGRSVDALCGFSGVLYVRKFFPEVYDLHDQFLKYTLMDDDVYYNDDIMISAFLSKNNIDRRVMPNIPMANEGKPHDPETDVADNNAISFDKIKFLQRFRNSINKADEWGFFQVKQPVSLWETIGGHIGIVVLLIIVLFFMLYISIMSS
jgi:hypothetical protein